MPGGRQENGGDEAISPIEVWPDTCRLPHQVGPTVRLPHVAPNYAQRRSALAKQRGLGRKPPADDAPVHGDAEANVMRRRDADEAMEVKELPARRARGIEA